MPISGKEMLFPAKIKRLISETEDTITLMQERRSALISSVVTGKLQVPGFP